MGKNWIAGAIKKPGALKKSLHVKGDKNIPAKKLNKAAKKGGKLGARARLAKTLKSFKHGALGNEGYGLTHGMHDEADTDNSHEFKGCK